MIPDPGPALSLWQVSLVATYLGGCAGLFLLSLWWVLKR